MKTERRADFRLHFLPSEKRIFGETLDSSKLAILVVQPWVPSHDGFSVSIDTMLIYPGRLTWNLKVMVWKMNFLFDWVIFRFHANFPGCTWEKTPTLKQTSAPAKRIHY